MPICRSQRLRPVLVRHRVAFLPVIAAAALWACDDSSNEPPTGPASQEALTAKPAKKAPIAFASNKETDYAIYVMTPTGQRSTRMTDPALHAFWPTWAPDHTQLAFQSGFSNTHIYAVNADGSNLRQLTNDPVANDAEPKWSPDGQRIAFSRDAQIMIMNADGSGLTAVPHGASDADHYPSWSPDGIRLAVARDRDFNQVEQVWVISVDGTQAVQLTSGTFENSAPQWSPTEPVSPSSRLVMGCHRVT